MKKVFLITLPLFQFIFFTNSFCQKPASINENDLQNGNENSAAYFGPIGIEQTELQNKNLFRIYPVPTTDLLTVSLPESISLFKISIFDMSGKEVCNQLATSKTVNFNTLSLPSGVYFISIENDSIQNTLRFVKE